jgi:hypothetical protein
MVGVSGLNPSEWAQPNNYHVFVGGRGWHFQLGSIGSSEWGGWRGGDKLCTVLLDFPSVLKGAGSRESSWLSE